MTQLLGSLSLMGEPWMEILAPVIWGSKPAEETHTLSLLHFLSLSVPPSLCVIAF